VGEAGNHIAVWSGRQESDDKAGSQQSQWTFVSVCGCYREESIGKAKEQHDIEIILRMHGGVDVGKVEIHQTICDELNQIYEAKNHDYGDSFAKVRNELGNTVILVRLCDKLERLKSLLLGAEQMVNDEKIEDTLMDLANYSIMELVERQQDDNRMEAYKEVTLGVND
jgi:hypothetical protein